MAIDGWDGATLTMPAVRVLVATCQTDGWAVMQDRESDALFPVCAVMATDVFFAGECYGHWGNAGDRAAREVLVGHPGEFHRIRLYRIHPDDFAALNALAAAQPDGTWRATPDDDTEGRRA